MIMVILQVQKIYGNMIMVIIHNQNILKNINLLIMVIIYNQNYIKKYWYPDYGDNLKIHENILVS